MLAKGLNGTRIGMVWFLCLAVAVFSWRFMVSDVAESMDFVAYHAVLRPIAFFGHVTFAPIALALVPFQLWQGLRHKRPAVHRFLGRCYGAAVLIGGVTGLWLAVTTQAGMAAASGFGLLAVLWLGSTAWGISRAMGGDMVAHERWMIRSIALTIAGVMLRLYIPTSMAMNVPFDTAYPVIAWLCWAPNLLVAELLLRRRRYETLPA